jgi:hypothetical protein
MPRLFGRIHSPEVVPLPSNLTLVEVVGDPLRLPPMKARRLASRSIGFEGRGRRPGSRFWSSEPSLPDPPCWGVARR